MNFFPDAMALASNCVRPQQATACFRLAWFAVRSKALRLRVVEVSVQKLLECLNYRSLAKVRRIKTLFGGFAFVLLAKLDEGCSVLPLGPESPLRPPEEQQRIHHSRAVPRLG
jgi:hypothetical protein